MKSKTTLLLLCFPLLIQAQQTNQTGIGKSAIEREPAKQKTSGWYHPGTGGNSQFWDFNRPATISKEQSKKQPETGDEWLTGREKETFHDYYLSGDSLLCAGYENELTQVKFNRPQTLLTFPIEYAKSSQSQFTGRGKFNNELEMTLKGEVLTTTDGWGWLILPEGDTLKSVFRVNIFIRSIRQTAPLSHDFNINAPLDEKFDMSAMKPEELKNATWVIENIHRWYEVGSRTPIFETQETRVVSENEPTVTQRSTSIFKPDTQKRIASGLMIATNSRQPQGLLSPKQSFTYHLFPNPVQDNLQVTVAPMEKTSLSLSLYDIQGRQVLQTLLKEISDESTETISMSGVAKGSYILRIQVGSETVSENIVKQ